MKEKLRELNESINKNLIRGFQEGVVKRGSSKRGYSRGAAQEGVLKAQGGVLKGGCSRGDAKEGVLKREYYRECKGGVTQEAVLKREC